MSIIRNSAHGLVSDETGSQQYAQVVTALRDRWVAPQDTPHRFNVPVDEVQRLARETLDAMLTRRWRVTPWPPEDEYRELLSRVQHWVQRGKPIKIMLGYAPMKNPKTVRRPQADWAEFFALGHLAAWHNKVCSVYPPGVRIKIIFDDSTVRMANRYALEPMDSYINSVGRLIKAMGYSSFIVGTMRQSWFAWLFHFGFYQLAGRRVRRWEQDPANHETCERMLEFARRNLLLPEGLSPEEQEQRYREAAHRYRVYWEALQLSGFSRMGKKLVAMYMDGHQHHLRQQAALHLATVGKEQVTQPWQGEGALVDNGRGKLIPVVLTAGRREKLTSRLMTGLELLPQEGFDSIEVCQEIRSAASNGDV
jgi:hypothetical protein